MQQWKYRYGKWLTIQLHEDLFICNVWSSFLGYMDFSNYLCVTHVTYMYMPELLNFLNGIYLKPACTLHLSWTCQTLYLCTDMVWDLPYTYSRIGGTCIKLFKVNVDIFGKIFSQSFWNVLTGTNIKVKKSHTSLSHEVHKTGQSRWKLLAMTGSTPSGCPTAAWVDWDNTEKMPCLSTQNSSIDPSRAQTSNLGLLA